MDTRYLEYILALAETGNMTKAARKLYISQPTLSQFLSKQEHELGMPLFERSGGVYTLTPAGNLYAEYAAKVLALNDGLKSDLERISNTSRIRIGTSASRAMQMFTSILADFRRYYPKVELIMSDDNLLAMSSAVSRGEIDIAFVTANSLEQYKGQSMELKKEEVVLAAPSVHPFCQKSDKSRRRSLNSAQVLEAFSSNPFILQHKGACIRYLIDAFFDKVNFNPVVACSTNHAQSICDMVSSSIGVGFIPTGYAVDSPQITYFSLEPKMYRIHSILYRKDLIMGPPHRCLVDLAVQYVKDNWQSLSTL